MQVEVHVLSVLSIFSRPASGRSSGGTPALFVPHAVFIIPSVFQRLPALGHLGLCVLPWDAPCGDLSRVKAGFPPRQYALSLLSWWECTREEPPSPKSQDVLLTAEDEEIAEAEC